MASMTQNLENLDDEEETTNVGPLHRQRLRNFRDTGNICHCKNCSRKYTSKGNLNKHIKLKHRLYVYTFMRLIVPFTSKQLIFSNLVLYC